ncbi:MAG: M3 family metallopeptidase [Gaiellaceae bacterium]
MDNPLIDPSPLPFQLPPFDEIELDHFAPAFERGMTEQLAEVATIVSDTSAATFENTVLPLERSGQLLHRARQIFSAKTSADSDPRTDELQARYAARFAAHDDAIRLDPILYQRINAVHQDRGELEPDQRYLVERYHLELTLAGAALATNEKEALKETNAKLSTLEVQFEQALNAGANALALVVDDVAELDGLTTEEISASAAVAAARGLDGKYVLTLQLPTGHPFLASLTNRETRRRLSEAQRARGSTGDDHDTRELLLSMVRLRADRARLLGFENHASAEAAENTAGTSEAIRDFLERLAPAAARNARDEQQAIELQAGFPVEAWDWPFVAEQVRQARYDVDLASIRPYFEAERVLRDGVFFAASALYGLAFTERDDLVGYHPAVRVFEVQEEDTTPVGLYLLDLYTRDGKNGGAWMNSIVDQSSVLDMPTAVVVNVLNVPKPAAGEPTLLTYDETITLFHEFGHALHGLLARVRYPKAAGTNVPRDFLEFPSLVNEMWMLWPEVLANYAVHVDTGEPLPAAVVEKLLAARAFNSGYNMSEYLAAALIDLAWHELDSDAQVDDVATFESRVLADAGLDLPAVPPRYSSPYFAHIFAGGYSAGYYSYIWSEVLDADTVEWFEENGGLTRANGERFRRYVLGVGGSRDPLECYREFRGRGAEIEPLLRRHGLTD